MSSKHKPNSARAEVLKDQIAHLKVLLAVSEQELPNSIRNVQVATQNLMVQEAQIATFTFRINEFQDELDGKS